MAGPQHLDSMAGRFEVLSGGCHLTEQLQGHTWKGSAILWLQRGPGGSKQFFSPSDVEPVQTDNLQRGPDFFSLCEGHSTLLSVLQIGLFLHGGCF